MISSFGFLAMQIVLLSAIIATNAQFYYGLPVSRVITGCEASNNKQIKTSCYPEPEPTCTRSPKCDCVACDASCYSDSVNECSDGRCIPYPSKLEGLSNLPLCETCTYVTVTAPYDPTVSYETLQCCGPSGCFIDCYQSNEYGCEPTYCDEYVSDRCDYCYTSCDCFEVTETCDYSKCCECQPGFYSITGNWYDDCLACPLNSYSPSPGAVGGCPCLPGFSSPNGFGPCRAMPTIKSTSRPVVKVPVTAPVRKPTRKPSYKPTRKPSYKPTRKPSFKPVGKPVGKTYVPSVKPVRTPTAKPVKKPTRAPTVKPVTKPIGGKTYVPSVKPVTKPIGGKTYVPSVKPVGKPYK